MYKINEDLDFLTQIKNTDCDNCIIKRFFPEEWKKEIQLQQKKLRNQYSGLELREAVTKLIKSYIDKFKAGNYPKVLTLPSGEKIKYEDIDKKIDSIENKLPKPTKPVNPKLYEVTKKKTAKDYLQTTDWYVIRYMETGKPIPQEVKVKRQECRNILSKGNK
jgi:hypothetical protein